jgi:trk system potassium uptake protein TrkA
MKKNYIVIGMGGFGFSVARTLYELGNDVLAVDSDEDSVNDISPYVTQAVQIDATDEASLKTLGISNMDAAIVGMGDDIKASILVTLLCKELGAGMVIAKAQDTLHAKVLLKVGADRVVNPERDTGIRIAQGLASTNILECIDLSDNYTVAEIQAFKEWQGKTLKELDLRKTYGINVMAIKSEENKLNISPLSEDTIQHNDVLVVIGNIDDLQTLEETAKKRSR